MVRLATTVRSGVAMEGLTVGADTAYPFTVGLVARPGAVPDHRRWAGWSAGGRVGAVYGASFVEGHVMCGWGDVGARSGA